MHLDTFKTKTFWVGVIAVLTGIVIGVFDKDWSKASTTILGGLAVITGRDAISKLN